MVSESVGANCQTGTAIVNGVPFRNVETLEPNADVSMYVFSLRTAAYSGRNWSLILIVSVIVVCRVKVPALMVALNWPFNGAVKST